MKIYTNRVLSSVAMVALVATSMLSLFVPATARAASSIEFTSNPPEGCVFAGAEINVAGIATATAEPGKLEQYKVDVNWGDGSNSLADIQGGTFGEGKGESTKTFSASHTYTAAGTFSIVATVYHQSVNGNDNVDTKAQEYEICVIPDPETFTLTYTAGTGGTITGTSPQEVVEGEDGVAVVAVPNVGYSFVNWSDGVLTASRTETNVTADVSVTANFALDPVETYTITVNQGANGSITPGTQNDVAEGSGVLFTIVPDTGFHILDVLVDTVSQGAITTYEFLNVMADHVITATFEANAPDTYALTYAAGLGGSISGTASQVVPEGGSGTAVTAIADIGYDFVKWSDDSVVNPRTDTNVTADASYMAIFAEEEPPVCDAEASQTIVSDTLTLEGGDATVPVSPIIAAWTAGISGATWIWGENPISDSVATTEQTFTRTFMIVGTPTGATLNIAADNTYTVSINGNLVGTDLSEQNYNLAGQDVYVIPAEDLVSGENTITITVTNIGLPGSTPLNNPAGLLYKLVVTNNECEVPPLPVCSDKVDNDNDGLTDAADPACHTDGDVNNPESYDEKIDSEVNESAACSDGLDNDGDQLIDSLDPNCLTDGEWDPQDDDESSPTTPPADVCSNIEGTQETVPSGYVANDGVCEEQRSSGGGGGNRRGSVRGASTGEVLGASCGLYMDRYLKLGAPTNDEVQVIKLQAFLNTEGLFNRVPTGVFDMRTHNAVKDFQEKYFTDILTPWGLTGPTGLVYLTTLHKINMIECPDLMLQVPPLTPWTSTTNTKFAQ